MIGQEAEEIVYQYCACDRQDFFSKLYNDEALLIRNRFTGENTSLSDEMLRSLCELTVANEVEIAIDNPDFVSQHGEGLYNLFLKMSPFVSQYALAKSARVLIGEAL